MKKNKGMSRGKMAAIGAGVAAVGAGAYYLLGPKSKTHQRKVSILIAKIRRDVNREMKKAKTASVPVYHKAVDVVTTNYAKQYKMREKDVKAIAKELKKEWKNAANKAVKKSKKILKKKI